MSTIHIDPPTTDGPTLRTTVSPSRDLARFFRDDALEVTYDTAIADVPESILVIPALAQVCPVAWANGADVAVERVDASFAAALEDVKTSMCAMYDFLEGGSLYADEVVGADATGHDHEDDETERAAKSGLLFTGGVDSTTSYVRHREEEPTLISIRGWTITPDEADDEQWRHQVERTNTFAAERGLESAFIEANMLSFLDHPMLLAHYKRYVDGGWYSSVGHGLGLLGLCAPMAHARGLEDLYMAATHWEGIDLEWGSRPDIDDHVRWTGTECHHDAYDLSRQERLDLIADYVDLEAPDLQLQTCNVRMDGNCGSCEKCYRTAVGLRLSGLEPAAHGYPFSDDDYAEIREGLEDGRWILGDDERYMWADIRDRVRETEPGSAAEAEFFAWLVAADLSTVVDNSGSPLHHRVLRAGARNTPTAVYSRLYPAWSAAKSGYRRLGSSR